MSVGHFIQLFMLATFYIYSSSSRLYSTCVPYFSGIFLQFPAPACSQSPSVSVCESDGFWWRGGPSAGLPGGHWEVAVEEHPHHWTVLRPLSLAHHDHHFHECGGCICYLLVSYSVVQCEVTPS